MFDDWALFKGKATFTKPHMFKEGEVTEVDTDWQHYTATVYCKPEKGMMTALVVFPYGRLGKVRVFLFDILIKILRGTHMRQRINVGG